MNVFSCSGSDPTPAVGVILPAGDVQHCLLRNLSSGEIPDANHPIWANRCIKTGKKFERVPNPNFPQISLTSINRTPNKSTHEANSLR
jgi:hypothetical protein